MDKRILEVAARLATVRETLGARVCRAACGRALVAIAGAVQAEAERRAGPRRSPKPTPPTDTVVRFPLARARANRGQSPGREP
jgi:hypothetical protein